MINKQKQRRGNLRSVKECLGDGIVSSLARTRTDKSADCTVDFVEIPEIGLRPRDNLPQSAVVDRFGHRRTHGPGDADGLCRGQKGGRNQKEVQRAEGRKEREAAEDASRKESEKEEDSGVSDSN
jgi:hypothetical protein